MKKLLTAFIAGAAALTMAAEKIAPEKVTDLKKVNGAGTLTVNEEKVFELKGVANFLSEEILTIDPSKMYKLSGEFRAKSGTTPARLYFGFAPMDAQKKGIISEQIQGIKGTETVLVADAKAGDTVLKAQNCAKWKKGGLVAFNVKADMSDIPNADLSAAIDSITKDGEVYIIKLKKPLKKDYAKGVAIRHHYSAGTYQYSAAAYVPLTNDWKTFSVVMNGEAHRTAAISSKKWWFSTRNVRILILGNFSGNKDSVLEFKNIKLEVLTR